MRIRFSYDAWFTTVAGLSSKIGRAVYFEGPVEPAAWVEAEVNTQKMDFLFQPLAILWRRDFGKTRRLTLDAGFEDEGGSIWFTEYKGNRAYLQEPVTADLLDEAEAVLRTVGADLSREDATHLLEPVGHRARKDVFDDRRTNFTEEDVAAARDTILREGGRAPLAKVLERIGGCSRQASAKLNAMSVRRIVRIDLAKPQMPDTMIDVPPCVTSFRLKAFLQRFAVPKAD